MMLSDKKRLELKPTNTIAGLKKGDYFRLKNGKCQYVKGDYDRSSKKYSCFKADDINSERFFKGSVPIDDYTYDEDFYSLEELKQMRKEIENDFK